MDDECLNSCCTLSLVHVSTPPRRLVQRYELQYKAVSGGVRKEDEFGWITISSTIKSNKWTITDMTPGSRYCFRVKYRRLGGWSDFSPP